MDEFELMMSSFYEDHAIYDSFGGIVLAREEGKRIAKALGNCKAAILQNHGILTVAKSVDGAVFLFGAMDRCIEAQLLADAASAGRGTPTIKVDHETALYTQRNYTDVSIPEDAHYTLVPISPSFVSDNYIL
jgi:ribulose-5-phosphate 4-epimerase/fuculose-1-phosphate aldolase